MNEEWFFAQDDDSHWYLVPEHLREKWSEMYCYEDEEDAEDKFNNLFSVFRINGGPSSYVVRIVKVV